MRVLQSIYCSLMAGALLTASPLWAIDLLEFEGEVDDTIRSACHGYLVDMLPESLQGDAFDATGRCDPQEEKSEEPLEAASSPSGESIELGERVERNADIHHECDDEYMCIQQRVQWRDADRPITQSQYDEVASYCQGHYACIQHQLREGYASFAPTDQAAASGLSFDSLLSDESPIPSASHGNADSGFALLEAAREQERREKEVALRYQDLMTAARQQSLERKLHDDCGELGLGYRTPASPRSIREDMRRMEAQFKKHMACSNRVAGQWDATGYQNALYMLETELAELGALHGVDTRTFKRPQSIDQQVQQMQRKLEGHAETLERELRRGPDWIESLYASGTYQRPNKGPSTMAALSQALNAVNQDLMRQNQQTQRQLQQLMRQAHASAPRVQAPRIQVPRITAPKVQQPMPIPTPGTPSGSAAQDLNAGLGATQQFGCYAPRQKVCIQYKMPESALKSYRDRCRSQGNQLLSACRTSSQVCEYGNFAGSITIYNYDNRDHETRSRNCQELQALSR